jgi:hypothetical protein
MRRLAAAIMAVALLASPAAAHHTELPEPQTDADAMALYFKEFQAQNDKLLITARKQTAATSSIEKADLTDELRAGIEATISHMASLERRECFEPMAALFDSYMDIMVKAYSVDTDPDEFQRYVQAAGLIGRSVYGTLLDGLAACAPEAP